VAANVPVQYQVTNLLMWATNHAEGGQLLERLANREVVRYLISADLNELLTTGRNAAAAELRQRIQAQANELGLGVQILFVGLQNIHPPVQIAPAYQEVVGAMLQKTGKALDAEAYAAQTLPEARAEAIKRRRTAEIYAIRTAADAEAQALQFTNRMVAYEASPAVFAARGYLQSLVRGAQGARKFVIAATNTQDVIQLNLEDKLRPGMDDVVVPPPKPK
jgi:regulator of protease activity HflC (stomatin/prohibitin superfamily)